MECACGDEAELDNIDRVRREYMERIVLTASDGMVLTDGTIYGKVIYLGSDRTPDHFYEITKEEYEKRIEPEVNEDVS